MTKGVTRIWTDRATFYVFLVQDNAGNGKVLYRCVKKKECQ